MAFFARDFHVTDTTSLLTGVVPLLSDVRAGNISGERPPERLSLTLYSARVSPENTHKLMGFYMEVLILGVILQYMVSASLTLYTL